MSKELWQVTARELLAAEPIRPEIGEYASELEQDGRMTPVVQEAIDKARAMRLDNSLIFYISGALTEASPADKLRYEQVSEAITNASTPYGPMAGYVPHVHGTDPIKNPHVSPAEVHDIDKLWALEADAHINFLQPMAHGNAIELGWAEAHDIPVVYVSQREARLSRLVLGMRNVVGTVLYDDFTEDGVPQIQELLDEIQSQMLASA